MSEVCFHYKILFLNMAIYRPSSSYQLNAHFLYSIAIYMLHYIHYNYITLHYIIRMSPLSTGILYSIVH